MKTVKKDDVVVDLGTGTGILAAFAMDAGAKKVYAVENDVGLCETLEKNFRESDTKGKFILIEGDATEVRLPEKVDVVICEMIATGLIDELQIPVMNNIFQYCKPYTKIILSRMQNFVELVHVNNEFYGHELRVIQYEYTWNKSVSADIFSEKFMYSEIDFSEVNTGEIDIEAPLLIKKNGSINGLRITNKTTFSDNSILESTAAYCMPLIVPLEPLEVKAGEVLMLHLRYKMCLGMDHFNFSLHRHEATLGAITNSN